VIDALISGRLFRQPQPRTSRNGNAFLTCTIKVPAPPGEDGKPVAVFVDVIAVKADVIAALSSLPDGDAVAVAGELTVDAWLPKDGGAPRTKLKLNAHAVLSQFAVTRRRKAAQGELEPQQEARQATNVPPGHMGAGHGQGRSEAPVLRPPGHSGQRFVPAIEQFDDDL
jgi:single-stranded DNA-binding protein